MTILDKYKTNCPGQKLEFKTVHSNRVSVSLSMKNNAIDDENISHHITLVNES